MSGVTRLDGASSQLNVAQLLLHYLKIERADYLFGVPGAGVARILDTLRQQTSLKYIVCRHETGAAYIADGYFRATGRPGVVLVTSGPGATNALTGTMNAHFSGSAMVTVTGEVSEKFLGRGYLQEGTDCGLNIRDIYNAATGYSAEIPDPSSAKILIEQALRDALSIPRNGVHLSIPDNVASEPVDPAPRLPDAPEAYRATPGGADPGAVRTTFELLLAARRPLIFLGNGCRDALRDPETARALRLFVERHAIPVMTTLDGKGLFPELHWLSLRVYGFADCRWPQYWLGPDASGPSCDALLVIGSALGGLSTDKWNTMLVPAGPFIQVDIDQSAIGRGFPVTNGIVAEAGAFIRSLWHIGLPYPPDLGQVAARRADIQLIKQSSSPFADPGQYESTAKPIEPAALIRTVQAHLPPESMIFIDAGNCVGWGGHYFVVDPPQEFHSPTLAMGPMGFGVGAVVGAKLGREDWVCLALVGDGAFLMHGAEVSTAQAHRIGAIWIVLSENDLRMVTQGMAMYTRQEAGWEGLYRLGTPDLVKFAEGLGANAYRVDTPQELDAAMPAVLHGAGEGRPQVVVARINRDRVPPYYLKPYYG